MSKLQPNFSWQKYQGEPEDQANQFQYQLQSQHILVANATNATIDDSSYWTKARQTSFTWINGKPIFTITLPTVAWTSGGTVDTIPFAATGLTIILMTGTLTNGTITLPLPYVDAVTAANSIGFLSSGTAIVLTSGGTDYSAYSGYVTIYYV